MEPEEFLHTLHQRNEVVHEAIKYVAHYAAFRYPLSNRVKSVEERLYRVSYEVTKAAQRHEIDWD